MEMTENYDYMNSPEYQAQLQNQIDEHLELVEQEYTEYEQIQYAEEYDETPEPEPIPKSIPVSKPKPQNLDIEYKSLGNIIEEVRDNLYKIDPFSSDITIINVQLGIGKSTWSRKYCNDHPEIESIGIASKRHNFLEECRSSIGTFNHWYGLQRKCPRRNEPWFKRLVVGLNLRANIICSMCGKKSDCLYHGQFIDTHRCGFPTEYLRTKNLSEKL